MTSPLMRLITAILLTGGLTLPLISCGGGGGSSSGGTEYDYGINLTPEKTSVAPAGTINLNMRYDAPSSNAGIKWTLSCSQTNCGSVSGTGIYTAPATVELQMKVGIRATSNDKPTSSYYVEVWVTGPLRVTLTPDWPIVLETAAKEQFSATVNSPDTGIIWQVNGVTGGNSTVGTISTSGLYTAPAEVPDPATVTISALAHADQTAYATKEVTITLPQPIIVEISPRDQTVGTGATLQFSANVLHTSDTAVKWQVNGVDGGNATVGTISSAGLFTAPDAVPTPARVTITAISHANSAASDSTFVTIVGLHNSLLNGAYTFEISGPDANGQMVAMIGVLAFDGQGRLTGIMDTNSIAAANPMTAEFTGSYTIGQQNVGRMTIDMVPPLTLSFTINEAGTDAKLIEWDTRGTRFSGLLQKQIASDLALDHFAGDYAFSCSGNLMGGERMAAIGRFHSAGNGTITDGAFDTKEVGEVAVSLAGLTGSVTMTHPTYGRGLFAMTQSGASLIHFAYYMTNANDIFFLSFDPVPADNPVLVGRLLRQTGGPFSNASLDGPSVVGLAGNGADYPSNTSLLVGQWHANSSTHMVTGTQDLITDGAVTQNQSLSASYSIESNGRGTFSGSTMFADVFYMIAKNKAFLLQAWGQEVMLGIAEPQQVTTFNDTLFSGKYRIGPISFAKWGAALSQGFIIADGTTGAFTGAEEVMDQENVDVTFEGNYSVAADGRTLITISGTEPFHYVAYPVSNSRFIGISIEPGDNRANLTSLDR